jgi:ABC-type lipoprotein release transport system permease subunit
MTLRLAARNLLRNRWRTGLTVCGVAAAVGLLIWITGFMDAYLQEMATATVRSRLGHVQVTTADYVDKPTLFNGIRDAEGVLAAASETPGVEVASPRLVAFGLIGHEQRSAPAQLLGVDPGAEAALTGLDAAVVSGRWLTASPEPPPAPREAVLGQGLAEQLGVGVGAELVVFLQGADGSLGNDVMKVVGVAKIGDSNMNRLAVYLHRADVAWLTALEGSVHEISLLLGAGADPAAVAADLSARLAKRPGAAEGPALAVRPWKTIVPELADILELSERANGIFYFIIFIIAGLGIFNTQRMTVLERRRELGVLLAVGLTPLRLAAVVLTEAVLVSALGALVGALLGGAVAYYHHVHGLSMAMFASTGDGSFDYMGLTIRGLLYYDFTWQMLAEPALALVVVGLLCGLIPAVQAARLTIVTAISGRT